MSTPFHVLIKLRTPLVEPKNPFHLDALLSALRVQKAAELDSSLDPRSVHHDLPLERYISPSGEWCFKASAFHYIRHAEAFPWMATSRFNIEQASEDRFRGFLKTRSLTPNLAGGPFKMSKFTIDLLWADIEAWGVGDILAIRQLLSGCQQVGARRGTAYGAVKHIEVEPESADACQWFRRTLPADVEKDFGQGQMTFAMGHLRAPYWDRREHRRVAIPLDL